VEPNYNNPIHYWRNIWWIAFFCNVTPYSLVNCYQCFRGICCISLQRKCHVVVWQITGSTRLHNVMSNKTVISIGNTVKNFKSHNAYSSSQCVKFFFLVYYLYSVILIIYQLMCEVYLTFITEYRFVYMIWKILLKK
jgi:hypothetical protein